MIHRNKFSHKTEWIQRSNSLDSKVIVGTSTVLIVVLSTGVFDINFSQGSFTAVREKRRSFKRDIGEYIAIKYMITQTHNRQILM